MVIDFNQYLPIGKKDAINAARLREKIGVKSDRELRQCVEAARLEGQLICSGNAGYYIPANREEIREYINRIEAQASSMFAILQTARAALNDSNLLLIDESAAEGAPDPRQGLQAGTDQAAGSGDVVHEKNMPPAGMMDKLRERLKA